MNNKEDKKMRLLILGGIAVIALVLTYILLAVQQDSRNSQIESSPAYDKNTKTLEKPKYQVPKSNSIGSDSQITNKHEYNKQVKGIELKGYDNQEIQHLNEIDKKGLNLVFIIKPGTKSIKQAQTVLDQLSSKGIAKSSIKIYVIHNEEQAMSEYIKYTNPDLPKGVSPGDITGLDDIFMLATHNGVIQDMITKTDSINKNGMNIDNVSNIYKAMQNSRV